MGIRTSVKPHMPNASVASAPTNEEIALELVKSALPSGTLSAGRSGEEVKDIAARCRADSLYIAHLYLNTLGHLNAHSAKQREQGQ